MKILHEAALKPVVMKGVRRSLVEHMYALTLRVASLDTEGLTHDHPYSPTSTLSERVKEARELLEEIGEALR